MKATLAPIFCLILATMLLQTGKAAPSGRAGFRHNSKNDPSTLPNLVGNVHGSKGHPSILPNLKGNEKEFYEKIVAPLTAKCADITFSPGLSIFQTMEKEMLCKNANKIAKLYTDLNGIYKQNKTHLVGTTQQAIRALVLLTDLRDLKNIYSDLLSWEVAKPIQDAFVQMAIGHDARANLKKAFIDTFTSINQWKIDVTEKLNEKRAKWDKLVSEKINGQRNKMAKDAKKVDQEGEDEAGPKEKEWEKIEADLNKAKDWDTVERRQIVFKFLCISYEMGFWFKKTGEEQLHWAMEQFVANLFVYSMRVDRPDYMGEPEIQGIAAKWPTAGIATNHPVVAKPPA